MREVKHDRVEAVLHRLAAEFIRNEATSASLITVTRVVLNPSGKDAKIFFTTLPDSEEKTAEKFLIRKTSEFKKYVRAKSKIGIIPHLAFKIDYGERNRQRLDELTSE
jgi:ribosome-binding factor A